MYHTSPNAVLIADLPPTNPDLQSLLAKGPHRFNGKKVAGFDSATGIGMKGTIYLWVLAAVLSDGPIGSGRGDLSENVERNYAVLGRHKDGRNGLFCG